MRPLTAALLMPVMDGYPVDDNQSDAEQEQAALDDGVTGRMKICTRPYGGRARVKGDYVLNHSLQVEAENNGEEV